MKMCEEFIIMDPFIWLLLDVGRGRFFNSCKFWLYYFRCEAENTCACDVSPFVCACFLVSSSSGLGGICSLHVKRCKRGRTCLAAVEVDFVCLAEEGSTWAMFCVWGCVCSLSWHKLCVCVQYGVCTNNWLLCSCETAWRLTAFLYMCVRVMETLFNTIHFVFLGNPRFQIGWVAVLWEGLWQDGKQNSEEKYR